MTTVREGSVSGVVPRRRAPSHLHLHPAVLATCHGTPAGEHRAGGCSPELWNGRLASLAACPVPARRSAARRSVRPLRHGHLGELRTVRSRVGRRTVPLPGARQTEPRASLPASGAPAAARQPVAPTAVPPDGAARRVVRPARHPAAHLPPRRAVLPPGPSSDCPRRSRMPRRAWAVHLLRCEAPQRPATALRVRRWPPHRRADVPSLRREPPQRPSSDRPEPRERPESQASGPPRRPAPGGPSQGPFGPSQRSGAGGRPTAQEAHQPLLDLRPRRGGGSGARHAAVDPRSSAASRRRPLRVRHAAARETLAPAPRVARAAAGAVRPPVPPAPRRLPRRPLCSGRAGAAGGTAPPGATTRRRQCPPPGAPPPRSADAPHRGPDPPPRHWPALAGRAGAPDAPPRHTAA
jgi:hypothetical protein